MPVNNAKGRKKNERSTEMKQMTGTGSTRRLKRSTGLTDPTQTSAYHGWKRYLPWPAPTRETPETNSSTTVVEVFRRPCIPCPQVLQRMKFMTFCCIMTQIWKLLPSVYLLLTLSNRNLKSRYRHKMQNTSPTMNWHTKASQSQATGPRLAAYTMPNLYMGSLVKNWKEGSTRGYLTICKMHSTGPWTLNPGS